MNQEILFDGWTCRPNFNLYVENLLPSLKLSDKWTGEPVVTASVNLIGLEEGEIALNHNAGEELRTALADAGYIESIAHRTIQSGFVTFQVHKWTDEALKKAAEVGRAICDEHEILPVPAWIRQQEGRT